MAALTRTVQIICLAMLLAVVLAVFDWGTICRMKIEDDLRDCARTVRQSKLMLHDKERLLDVIERLEDSLRSGSQIDFRLWFRHHQTIHEMLDDEIEVRLLERELLRTEKDFEESEQ
jgi:uncharacterized membrane protein YcjF (UPF0283 family)